MKNKGFTLIELLAVIVILAIIALIIIPVISKIVKNTQEQANMRSVEGHIANINNNIAANILNNKYVSDGTYTFDELGFTNYPKNDSIRCSSYEISKNRVVQASNCMVKEKSYCYSNSRVESCENMGNLDNLVLRRANEIRNTPNTDISGRTGNIYYVSAEGDDSNDGLSEATPFKTLNKIYTMFENSQISDGSTILFRDGDMFRGNLNIRANDILIGSYGDISKGKPILARSLYDGAKEGTWTEVKPNIWKYQFNSTDPFEYDVGTIWFFCNEGNNNCTNSMNTLNRNFMYAYKKTTSSSYDETNIESKIDTILTHDLEMYHVGHAYDFQAIGGALYLYSTSNPSTRFDEIEFAEGGNIIYAKKADFRIDNMKLLYGGRHGITSANINNYVVTNSEFGFIGGSVHNYNSGEAERLGNAIQTWGYVDEVDGRAVTDGFLVNNNYIYQVYDTGITFQYTTDGITRMQKVNFTNNIVEYCNYSLEYWNYTTSTNPDIINESYINNFTIANNVLRKAGYGISSTRPDGNAATTHIKTWNHDTGYNILKGNFEIRNNIFGETTNNYVYLRADEYSHLPKVYNNTFYGNNDSTFGYYFAYEENRKPIIYDKHVLEGFNLANNNYVVADAINYSDESGSTGDAEWVFDADAHTLTITGTGAMADYTESNLPPWNKYKNTIYKIVIDTNVTKIGLYAFYDLTRVTEIDFNGREVVNVSSSNTPNYAFYNVGVDTNGAKLIIGPNVGRIPACLTDPTSSLTGVPYITEVVMNSNLLRAVVGQGLARLSTPVFKFTSVRNGVDLYSLAIGRNQKLKFFITDDSIIKYRTWALAENRNTEKVVLGNNIGDIGDYTFRYYTSLKTLVIPTITDPSIGGTHMFESVTQHVDVYGDANVSTWLSTFASSQTNIVYHPLSEYKSTIRSNIGVEANDISYNGEYTFTTNRDVGIKMYYDASDGKRYSVDADYTKEGNTYTITNIKADIYIEAK